MYFSNIADAIRGISVLIKSDYFANIASINTEKNYKSVPNEIEFAVAKNNFLIEATYSVRWRDEQCSLARRTMFVGATNKVR